MAISIWNTIKNALSGKSSSSSSKTTTSSNKSTTSSGKSGTVSKNTSSTKTVTSTPSSSVKTNTSSGISGNVAATPSTKTVTTTPSSSVKTNTGLSGGVNTSGTVKHTVQNTTPVYSAAVAETNDEDNDYILDYADAALAKYNESENASKKASDAEYENSLNSLNANYRRYLRKLFNNSAAKGYDEPVSSAENLFYAKEKAKNELDRSKLESDAENASNNYSNWNNIASLIANSNLSNSNKKKWFSSAV